MKVLGILLIVSLVVLVTTQCGRRQCRQGQCCVRPVHGHGEHPLCRRMGGPGRICGGDDRCPCVEGYECMYRRQGDTESVFEINRTEDGRILSVDGPEAKLLEMILSVLDEEFEIILSNDTDWGNQTPDRNWTGLIGMLGRGEADFSVNEVAVTEARAQVVDFSPIYISSPVTFFTRAPGLKDKLFVYTYPFTFWVWMCLLVTLILGSLIFRFILTTGDSKMNRHKTSRILTYFFAMIVNQGCAQRINKVSARLFLGVWMLTAMVIMFNYSGILLSLILSPMKEPALQTVTDLSTAVQEGRYSCGVLAGTYYQEIFNNSFEGAIGEIGKHIRENKNFFNSDLKDVLKLIRESNMALINSKLYTMLYLSANDPDSYFVSDDFFMVAHGAVAMRKGLPEKPIINDVVHRVNEGGFYLKWMSDTLYEIKMKAPKKVTETRRKLTLDDMKGVFLILFVGYVVSAIVLMSELFLRKFSIF